MNMLILRRKNGELPWMDIYQKKGGKKDKQTMEQWREGTEAEIMHEMEKGWGEEHYWSMHWIRVLLGVLTFSTRTLLENGIQILMNVVRVQNLSELTDTIFVIKISSGLWATLTNWFIKIGIKCSIWPMKAGRQCGFRPKLAPITSMW